MLSKAQRKNASRGRRRERGQDDDEQRVIREQREKWARDVIVWYCQLWNFVKATAWMNRHKQSKLRALVHKGCDGRFDNWCKADGYVRFRILGNLRRSTDLTKSDNSSSSSIASSSGVDYEFYDVDIGHFVLTASGSFYELGERAAVRNVSLESDKKSDFRMFHFLEGCPPFK
tara:strand:- start:132 stop:650 length:519 start_codon:yes stop_codon:yes gene_type:complete